MRIWRSYELGNPLDVLRLENDDAPEPGPGQVQIETKAVGLTFPDVLSCRGEYQVPTRLPYTPGGETAGVISALGEGVEGLEVGAAVAVLGGGLREVNVAAANSVFPYPTEALSAAQAAAVPVNYGTAWFALHDRAHVQPEETVLITGAAGGTGTACIQLALRRRGPSRSPWSAARRRQPWSDPSVSSTSSTIARHRSGSIRCGRCRAGESTSASTPSAAMPIRRPGGAWPGTAGS